MRKVLFLSLFLILISGICFAESVPSDYLRGYDGIEIAKGTFIPVVNVQEISTEYADAGTKVKFISTNDLYLYETNVVPKDTEFYGYVEKVNEPVIGTNGSMVIKLTKLKLLDGFEIPIKAYVYTSNNNILGGELTAPEKWQKMPVYRQAFLGYAYAVPGGTRLMGQHTILKSGADVVLILAEPVFITHTLTN